MYHPLMPSRILFPLLALCLVAPVSAQQRGQPPPAAPGQRETAGAAEEKSAVTSHTLRIDGREIKYNATAGTLPIRGADGRVQARMFFVAYTKDIRACTLPSSPRIGSVPAVA